MQGFAKKDFADPGWQDWTPGYSNITVGNGTVTARYQQIGTTVHVYFELVLGSTTTIGTAPSITIPVTAASYYSNTDVCGDVLMNDTGTATYYGQVRFSNTTSVIFDAQSASGSYVQLTNITASVPFTWTTSDILTAEFTYEAAASALIELGANNDHGSLSGLSDDDHTAYAKGQLGYAQVTANQGSITTETDLTGLSVAVSVAASRRVKITGYCFAASTVGTDQIGISIKESTTRLTDAYFGNAGAVNDRGEHCLAQVIISPSAGSHTYKLTARRINGTGTITMGAGSTVPSFILVEDIGPA